MAQRLLLWGSLFILSYAWCQTPQRTSVPFYSGLNGYHTYRIPAIIKTKKTLLAFAEARKNASGDFGDIDLVLRRSVDQGRTWQSMQLLWDQDTMAVQNPVPIFDVVHNRVVLLFNTTDMDEHHVLNADYGPTSGRRAYITFSDDDGKTWSPPTDITPQVKLPDWRWHAFGPVHGIQLRHSKKGRLLAPVSISIGKGNMVYSMALVYSDDFGKTWHIGAVDTELEDLVQANETTIAELRDGRVYINTRDQNGGSLEMNRAEYFSSDGGETLDGPTAETDMFPSPVVQCSVLAFGAAKSEILLFSTPSHPDKREDLVLMASVDKAKSWQPLELVHAGPAAYSDMVQLNKKSVGLLVETDRYGKIEFYTLNVARLLKTKELQR